MRRQISHVTGKKKGAAPQDSTLRPEETAVLCSRDSIMQDSVPWHPSPTTSSQCEAGKAFNLPACRLMK